MSATEITSEDTLNTPQIFCSDSNVTSQMTVASAPRPVILRANPHTRIPIASVQPVKTYKPIAPNPATLPSTPSPDNAMLLLKFPGGETIKLSNLPFVKADQPSPPSPVNQETRLKLKRVLSSQKSTPNIEKSSSQVFTQSSTTATKVPEKAASEVEKNELKERNRMSAQRSRQKKRQHFESLAETCSNMQKENSALNTENKILREEIINLKRLLGEHIDCSVTRQNGQREMIQNVVEPWMNLTLSMESTGKKDTGTLTVYIMRKPAQHFTCIGTTRIDGAYLNIQIVMSIIYHFFARSQQQITCQERISHGLQI